MSYKDHTVYGFVEQQTNIHFVVAIPTGTMVGVGLIPICLVVLCGDDLISLRSFRQANPVWYRLRRAPIAQNLTKTTVRAGLFEVLSANTAAIMAYFLK